MVILVDLKRIAENDNGIKVTDCVISVLVFVMDVECCVMLDVVLICGLNVL